jgi:hypothetical protein
MSEIGTAQKMGKSLDLRGSKEIKAEILNAKYKSERLLFWENRFQENYILAFLNGLFNETFSKIQFESFKFYLYQYLFEEEGQ